MLRAIYNTQDEIPAEYRALYTERNGKWELTQVEGIKTQADVDRLQGALQNERDDHGRTKLRYSFVGDLDSGGLEGIRSENQDLKNQIAAGLANTPDPAAIEKLVEDRVTARVSVVERKLEEATGAIAQRDGAIRIHEGAGLMRQIGDELRSATTGENAVKLVDTAFDDVKMYADNLFRPSHDGMLVTKEGATGVDPGLDMKQWLTDIGRAGTKKHWFPRSRSAGAKDGEGGSQFSGDNPFDGKNPKNRNIGKIMQLISTNREEARVLARQAEDTEFFNSVLPPA